MTRRRQRQRDVEAALQDLYAALPALECRGLCQESCGPVLASAAELDTVAARGVDLTRGPAPWSRQAGRQGDDDLTCPALTTTFGAGTCSVYDVRPMVCRLWGVVEGMACPHGCIPQGGHLSDAQGRELLAASLRAGGRPSAAQEEAAMTRAGLRRRA